MFAFLKKPELVKTIINTKSEPEMTESEKHGIVEKAVFDLPEQPYWMVDSFDER